MRSFSVTAVAFVAFISLWLCGCDYTRRGGAYRLAFQSQTTQNSAVAVEAKDEEALRQVLETWLLSRGFQEFKYSAQRAVWRKGGARVYVSQQAENELMIEVSAMGYKRDLRVSEQTEHELLAYLEKQPGLVVTHVPPSKPPVN